MDDASVPVDAWGITDGYHDIDGVWHATSPETRLALRDAMGDPDPGPLRWFVNAGATEPLWGSAQLVLEDGTVLDHVGSLPPDLPLGWHELHPDDGGPRTELVVVPPQCPGAGRRRGLAVLAHELWSADSWEMGDLDDVATLAARLGHAGGDTILLGPLHARLPGADVDPSPYSPSTRRWWDPLWARPGEGRPDRFAPAPRRLVERHRVYDEAMAALGVEFDAITPGSDSDQIWRDWVQRRGEELVRYCRWLTVVEAFGSDTSIWPRDLATPRSTGWHDRFSTGEWARRSEFHAWCQWRVDAALARIAATGTGLITDLAVGFHPDGFDAWDLSDVTCGEVRLGAPPDPFAREGQNWGLPPMDPWAVSRARFEPWLGAVRTGLVHGTGLRIDHVIGLSRQFWIPPGGGPEHGAYVRQPREALMALLTLEAHRAGAFVVGEDLGTVEPSMRTAMAQRSILGIRVAIFTDDPPATWPSDTLATVTTHDLPTIAGILSGPDPDVTEFRRRLFELGATTTDPVTSIATVHRHMMDAGSDVVLLTADDLCASPHRPNQPGVVGPPSWCTRLPRPVEEIPLDIFSVASD